MRGGRTRDDSELRALGARAVRERLAALRREESGVRRAADSEHLHRMRVASRRLRAAVATFAPCWGREWRPAWRRELRRLTRALGAARDLDVQIAFVAAHVAALPDPRRRPGAERLLLRLQQARERRQARVVRALDRFAKAGVADGMANLTAHVAAPPGAPEVALNSPGAIAAARRSIARRLDALLALGPHLPDPREAERHHELRIAAKRLRYALELFLPLDGGGLKPALKAARSLQQALGDLHDCDVWIAWLPGFIEAERRRTLRYFGHAGPFRELRPGLAGLLEDRQAQRAALHARCLELWNEAAAAGVWEDLRGRPPLAPEEGTA